MQLIEVINDCFITVTPVLCLCCLVLSHRLGFPELRCLSSPQQRQFPQVEAAVLKEEAGWLLSLVVQLVQLVS